MEAIRAGGILIVNDAYNANPGSVRAAIRSFRDVAPAGRRRIAVLGEMLELGDRSQALHRELGRFAARAGLDVVVGVGPEMREAIEALRREGCREDRARWFEDLERLEGELPSIVRPGDCVLLKGSRGAALERCLPGLRRIGEGSAEAVKSEERAEGTELSALVQGR
jgi:UDP-N-acetylmuramoyl-tripeptide--D-alanyl-D-alanine ligase